MPVKQFWHFLVDSTKEMGTVFLWQTADNKVPKYTISNGFLVKLSVICRHNPDSCHESGAFFAWFTFRSVSSVRNKQILWKWSDTRTGLERSESFIRSHSKLSMLSCLQTELHMRSNATINMSLITSRKLSTSTTLCKSTQELQISGLIEPIYNVCIVIMEITKY